MISRAADFKSEARRRSVHWPWHRIYPKRGIRFSARCTKAPALLTVLLLAASTLAAGIGEAEAKHGRKGALATGIFLGAVGAAALAGRARETCYQGELRCRWVRGECFSGRYGEVDCAPSGKKCYRPVFCD
jgi:hypothetical protein